MDTIKSVTERLYHEANSSNPDAKKDIPSFAYEQVESANKRRLAAQSQMSLYDWCQKEIKAKS